MNVKEDYGELSSIARYVHAISTIIPPFSCSVCSCFFFLSL
jgi:hypothetical protein